MEASPPQSPSTTFVHADKTTFRRLVQKLTGFHCHRHSPKLFTFPARIRKTSSFPAAPGRSAFKLQERRHNIRKIEIKLGLASLDQSSVVLPRLDDMLDCSLSLSPVTPLGTELTLSPSSTSEEEEERAIAKKGFYLHPSPSLSTPGGDPPELLSLFPLSSVPTQPN